MRMRPRQWPSLYTASLGGKLIFRMTVAMRVSPPPVGIKSRKPSWVACLSVPSLLKRRIPTVKVVVQVWFIKRMGRAAISLRHYHNNPETSLALGSGGLVLWASVCFALGNGSRLRDPAVFFRFFPRGTHLS